MRFLWIHWMNKNSRAIGIRGELEARDLLKMAGFEAKRGQQHKGTSDSPDVVAPEVAKVGHLEVKWVRGFTTTKMQDAYMKAEEECKFLQMPILLHRERKKRGVGGHRRGFTEKWLVTVDATWFFGMLRRLL